MTSQTRSRVSQGFLDSAAIVAIGVAISFAVLSPPDAVQGDLTRMYYVHVPSVITAYVAFGLTTISTIGYLVTRSLRWDRWALASAEVGTVFLGITIATGMIWGKPVWGVWWTWWDARLMFTALMFFIYLGYLGLRRSILDPENRARRSAILGIVAVVQIPIVHFSVVWWRTLHQPPTMIRPREPQIDVPLLVAFLVGLAAFLVVFSALLRRRLALADVEADLHAGGVASDAALAGDAVKAPQLGVTVDEAPR